MQTSVYAAERKLRPLAWAAAGCVVGVLLTRVTGLSRDCSDTRASISGGASEVDLALGVPAVRVINSVVDGG